MKQYYVILSLIWYHHSAKYKKTKNQGYHNIIYTCLLDGYRETVCIKLNARTNKNHYDEQ